MLSAGKEKESSIVSSERTYFWRYWCIYLFLIVVALHRVPWHMTDALVWSTVGAAITSVLHLAWVNKHSSKKLVYLMGLVAIAGIGQFFMVLAVALVNEAWVWAAQSDSVNIVTSIGRFSVIGLALGIGAAWTMFKFVDNARTAEVWEPELLTQNETSAALSTCDAVAATKEPELLTQNEALAEHPYPTQTSRPL